MQSEAKSAVDSLSKGGGGGVGGGGGGVGVRGGVGGGGVGVRGGDGFGVGVFDRISGDELPQPIATSKCYSKLQNFNDSSRFLTNWERLPSELLKRYKHETRVKKRKYFSYNTDICRYNIFITTSLSVDLAEKF